MIPSPLVAVVVISAPIDIPPDVLCEKDPPANVTFEDPNMAMLSLLRTKLPVPVKSISPLKVNPTPLRLTPALPLTVISS